MLSFPGENPKAIATLEQQYNAKGRAFYEVGWFKRFALATRYTSIASQVKRLGI
jgi:hypothetical protein